MVLSSNEVGTHELNSQKSLQPCTDCGEMLLPDEFQGHGRSSQDTVVEDGLQKYGDRTAMTNGGKNVGLVSH